MDTEPRRTMWHNLIRVMRGGRTTTTQELESQIQGLVDQGEAQGLITPHEGDMIEAVLELGETSAGQIMVPRTDLAMVASDASVKEIVEVIVESGHSRIPVYDEDPDHIAGVIHAKDLLPFWDGHTDPVDIGPAMRQPHFVPQSMPLDELLAAFKRWKVHLAVVVDEYGGTSGVVTLEDVLEEIVGEIEDEYDQEEEMVQEQKDGSLLVQARMEVDDLGERLGLELPQAISDTSFETVGGFVTTIMGRVPRVGEQTSWKKVNMKVTQADERRVNQVRVSLEPGRTDSAGD